MSVEEFQMKEVELRVLKVKEETSWIFQLKSERSSQQPSSRATCTLHDSTQYEIFCPRLLSCWHECAQATQLTSDQVQWLQHVCVTESCCVMPSGFKVVLIRFRSFLVMSWTAKERKEINLSSVFLQCLYLWNQTADIWLLLTQPRDICTSIVGRLLVE